MTKLVIFLFVLSMLFGFVFLNVVGCGGGSETIGNFSTPTNVPVVYTPTPIPEETGKIDFITQDRNGTAKSFYFVAKRENSLSSLANTSSEGFTAADGKGMLSSCLVGIWSISIYSDKTMVNLLGRRYFELTKNGISITIIEGIVDSVPGSPTVIPTQTGPTVVPTPSGSPSPDPNSIPTPLDGCAGVVVKVTDDAGATYESAQIILQDVTNVQYRVDFNIGEWHRIYNPVLNTIKLTEKKKLDLVPGKTYNVLIYLSGTEMGSRILTTVAGTTEVLTIKIHSGSMFDVFVLFDFKNTFTVGEYDPNGLEVINPDAIFMPVMKIAGDSNNYSKIVPLAHHDNVIKWWQSEQKLYTGNYSVSEMKIKRSGAVMSGTPTGSFSVTGNMNLHLQESGPVLSGNFQTFLPGGAGIDHQYGTVTTGSPIYLNCPVFTDSQEKIPWGQDYVLGREGFVTSNFSVMSTGTDNSSGYLMTSESTFLMGLLRVWTNKYVDKSNFSQNIKREIITYQYSDGLSMRLFSKLFRSNNEVRYFSLTAGQADAINIVTSTEPYAPKKMIELAQKLRQKK